MHDQWWRLLIRITLSIRKTTIVLITDANHNQTFLAFDIQGMVVGTAVTGKPLPARAEGDSLDGFEADLLEVEILDYISSPLSTSNPHSIRRG